MQPPRRKKRKASAGVQVQGGHNNEGIFATTTRKHKPKAKEVKGKQLSVVSLMGVGP
jgi:hypothetical protein